MVDHDVRQLFLDGAAAVAAALAHPAVAAAWDRPSVLEGQQVAGLAGHLARGGVWVVGDYLGAGEPVGPAMVEGPAAYFDAILGGATEEDLLAIRRRGAEVGAMGRDELVGTLQARLAGLGPLLAGAAPDRLVTVVGGLVVDLDDYLATRVVEQVVHLDDLARSVEADLGPVPEGAGLLAVAIGTDLARRRSGTTAVIRALYRQGFADALLPVL